MIYLSVILCTHNPNQLFLERVLKSLCVQTLSFENWELILVDNASTSSVEQISSIQPLLNTLKWRIVLETELGLTSARLAGIRNSVGNILVFVDDDTLLEPSYLENALTAFRNNPEIGAAGGRIQGEFELAPQSWMVNHLGNLAIRDFGDRPIRALIYNESGPWEPCGAGMVISAVIAREYDRQISNGARTKLDRIGKALSSCGDTDLARTATDMGFYLAYEPSLKLTHIIPRQRLTLRYLVRLSYSIQRDGWLLYRIRGKHCQISQLKFLILCFMIPFNTFSSSPRIWLLNMAEALGKLQGRRIYLLHAKYF
ncbi:glycosyltransferase family 2 protein [Calothrix membranacea FACHB-236]|nr:glycosyltransferase family 2 protein [Calothrix membranacea FACHB-236]